MLAAQLAFGITDEGAESRVALLELLVPIRQGDAGQGILVEIAKSRLAPMQQFLLPFALGDIDGKREKLRGLAGFVRQCRYDLADPDRLAVLVNVSVLNLNGAHFAGAQAPVTIGIAVVGMNE